MTQAETVTAEAQDEAAVKPPMRYPNSMLLGEIANVDIQRLLAEEETLRASQTVLREQRRNMKAKRDSLLRSRSVVKSKAHQKFDTAIQDLHSERRRIQAELDAWRARQGSRATARDKVTDLECEARLAAKVCDDAEALLQAELQSQQTRPATGKAAQQHKKAVEKHRKELATREAERLEKEETYAKARIEFNASTLDFAERNAREEEFRDLRMKLLTVQGELEKLNVQRRDATGAGAGQVELEATREEQEELDVALQHAEDRLAEIRQLLFPELQHFTYDPAYHAALIGRGGATLRQLQEDFAVAICVDMLPQGHGYVVGGAAEAEACVEAIHAIVQDQVARRTSTTLAFADPTWRKELVRPRGSTVERFQDEYDVRLQITDTEVTITGRRRDVAEAKEAIRTFLEAFTVREMTINVASVPALLGRGGRNITSIREESGVRTLRLNRERGLITAIGAPESIEQAFALCRSAIGEGEGVTKVVHADNAWVGAVIGPRGATIRQLEEETGAHVQCSGSTISLTGKAEAVKQAYDRVVALRRTERIVAADFKRLFFLTSAVVSLSEAADLEEYCQSPTARSPTVSRAGSSFITPLEAVRRATQCDQVVPLRAEGNIVLRGSPEAVGTAHALIKTLLRHNEPFSINVAFLDILRNFMVSRHREWDNKNLLDHIPTLFNSPVRIDVDWAARRLSVSSCSQDEARAAAQELISRLRAYSATHVRLISNFPEYAISRLLGTRGSTIRQLQAATDSEIVLVRDRAQVQVLNATGDVEKLESAVHAIRTAVFGEEDEEAEEDNPEVTSHSSGEAFAAQTPSRSVAVL